MTDQDKHDHWGDLVENVGATPPPEDISAEQPVEKIEDTNIEKTEDVRDEKAEVAEVPPRKVRAYRPSSGWDELASEFDLPIPEKPAPVEEAVAEEAVDMAPVEEEPVAVDESQDFVEAVEVEESPADISTMDEVAVDQTLDAEEQAEDVDSWLGANEFDALFDDPQPGDRAEDAAEDIAEESEGPSFGEGIEVKSEDVAKEEDAEEKPTGRRRKKRRRRSRKTASVDEKSDTDEVAAVSVPTADPVGFGAGLFQETDKPKDASDVFVADEKVIDASEVLDIEPSKSDAESSEGEESKKKRGRRRRRRGSGKKKDTAVETTVDGELVSEVTVSEDIADETPEDKAGRRRSHKKRGAPKREDAKREDAKREDAKREDADSEGRDRSEDDSDQDEIKAVSHRGIPSWDEAVEHIITTNLDNRSKKSSGSSSSRSRGGRGRSGREKSGSRKRSS